MLVFDILEATGAAAFVLLSICIFFFFNDTATTEIYTLSLHDALPIYHRTPSGNTQCSPGFRPAFSGRSEEHTSELQSRENLVCRLLLEKKKIKLDVAHLQEQKKRTRSHKEHN